MFGDILKGQIGHNKGHQRPKWYVVEVTFFDKSLKASFCKTKPIKPKNIPNLTYKGKKRPVKPIKGQ